MKKTSFIIWWVVVFVTSYIGLSALDMVPAELSEANFRVVENIKTMFVHKSQAVEASVAGSADSQQETETLHEVVLPERIVIKKIGVDAPITNPLTRDVGVLDRALLDGAVRYPGSGGLDDDSNMFLFAHSTGYRTVRNQAFKTFNHLGNLVIGDIVSVYARDTEYQYKVSSVSHVDSSDELVTFELGKKMLTLSTCDSFGEKTERFVVKAEFVKSVSLQEASI